jgi:hypothetical protein
MAVLATDDLITGACLYPDSNLVCLSGTWEKQCGFFSEELTPKVLKGIDGWILTALVIPDGGFVDGIAHRIRWPCSGIRGEVNHVRILPSCGMYPIMTIRQISDASQGSRIPATWDVGIGTSRLSSTRTPFDDSVRRGHPTGIIETLGLKTLRGYEGLDKAYPRLEPCHIDHHS